MPLLAVVQLRPTPHDPAGNRARTVAAIERAAAAGAALVVLPELATTGYAFPSREALTAEAEPLDGPAVAAWSAAAARHGIAIVAGLAERAAEGCYNTAVAIGPAGVAGVYRKAHLFAEERALFRPGNTGPVVVELRGIRVGLAICFDLRFVELPRALALLGAEVLAVPTTWTDLHKPQPYDARGWCMANVLAQAHAYINRVYVACADRVGAEAGVRYLGASVIFDPAGEPLAGPASPDGEELLVAPCEPARARDKALGAHNDLFADRRPELYGALLAGAGPPTPGPSPARGEGDLTATPGGSGAQEPVAPARIDGGCPRPVGGAGHGGEEAPVRASGALAGLLVVDLTWYLAGPYATMILADLGATVLKIEQPGGDPARGNGPFLDAERRFSSYFLSVNRGKRSVVLNLKHPRGLALLAELAAHADVLVENYLPGTLERLGLPYAALAERNPRLIYAACSGFGQRGPYARRPALDVIIQAMAGTMSITGEPDGPPLRVGFSVGDLAGALYTVIGILAALHERERSGRGQFVDVALLDAQVALLENAFARYFATGEVPARQGTSHPLITPFQAFATADGSLVVAASSQAQWRALCAVLERPDLCEDPRFRERADRTRHRAELVPILAALFAARPTSYWVERLLAAGVPCGPVHTIAEAAADPHLAAREMFVTLDVPGLGALRAVNSALHHLARTPAAPAGPPPALGEHTEAVLREYLGLTAAEVATLRAEGAVG